MAVPHVFLQENQDWWRLVSEVLGASSSASSPQGLSQGISTHTTIACHGWQSLTVLFAPACLHAEPLLELGLHAQQPAASMSILADLTLPLPCRPCSLRPSSNPCREKTGSTQVCLKLAATSQFQSVVPFDCLAERATHSAGPTLCICVLSQPMGPFCCLTAKSCVHHHDGMLNQTSCCCLAV